jgi:hypothetical protein
MLQKIDTCRPSDESSYINPHQKHGPINFAYYIKYCNGNFQPPRNYFGTDAAKVFYKKLKEDALYIARKYYDKIVPVKPLTEQEKIKFQTENFVISAKNLLSEFQKKL